MKIKAILKAIFITVLALVILYAFTMLVMFYLFVTMLDAGISVTDRDEAVEYCERLFTEPSIVNGSIDYYSFDELPGGLKVDAPKAIKGINFSLATAKNQYVCCFTSTEAGNADWGYRDCLFHGQGEGSRLQTKVETRTFGDYADCSASGWRMHSFEGIKECIN